MTISAISDGESGLSVRTKLNDLIAKTNTINADSTSVVSYFVDANSTTAAIRNGSVSAPFLTLSAAMAAIGKPTSAADSARLIVVNVESGSYTETVNIPEGRMMKITCNGYVALTGDVIYQSDGNARLGSGIRSFLSISGGDNNLAVSTHIARQGGMLINGRIVRKGTSATGITTHDLYLSNVQVTGGIGWDASIAQPGGTSAYLVRSRLQGTTSDQPNDASTGFPLVFQQVEDSKIEGTLKLSRFGGAVRTEFSSVAMTLLQAGGDIPPYGFYDCVWTGTNSIAAPANSLKLNGVSFVNSAAVTLSGGVTRQRIEDFTPLATGATDNAVTRFDGTTGLLQTSGVTIDDTNNVKGAASVQLTGGTGTDGSVSWNDGDGTIDVALKGGQTVLQVGQEQVVRVLNNTGAALSDGQVVYITGAQGQRPTVALADADIETTSSATIGIVTEPIASGAEGFVTLSGLVRHINTSAWTEGAQLYVSDTAGALTTTKPVPPTHAVRIGWVVRHHATSGSILVHVQNGYELDELHDVLIVGLADGQMLAYDAAVGLWKNTANLTWSESSKRLTMTDGRFVCVRNADTSVPVTEIAGVDITQNISRNSDPAFSSSLFTTKFDQKTVPASVLNGHVFRSYVAATNEQNIARVRSLRGLCFVDQGAQGVITEQTAINAYLQNGSSTATVTNGFGISCEFVQANGASWVNACGVNVPSFPSSPSPTNATHLLLGTTTIPSGNWGAYSATPYSNHFAGNVLIGTTTDNGSKLSVNGGNVWTSGSFISQGASSYGGDTVSAKIVINATGDDSDYGGDAIVGGSVIFDNDINYGAEAVSKAYRFKGLVNDVLIKDGISTAGSVEALNGVILKAPNGSKWRIVVSDTGALSTTAA